MAVVVLAYRFRPTLIDAVASLLSQEPCPQIVVVNSGGGDVEERLVAAGHRVQVVAHAGRLLPGAGRNVGISLTTAPFVAFLADDCMAEPGWVAARLSAHDAGAMSVASALVCHRPNNPIAVAAHTSLFVRRMPAIEPRLALAYGASYSRKVFAKYGLFREDMEGGEDTEFHKRMRGRHKPAWRPEVRTIHQGETTIAGFLREQFFRGRRTADAWARMTGENGRAVARKTFARGRFIMTQTLRTAEPGQRAIARMAVPLIAIGNTVYALGALSFRAPKTGASQ